MFVSPGFTMDSFKHIFIEVTRFVVGYLLFWDVRNAAAQGGLVSDIFETA
jgi:hypothetical protein